MRRHASDRVWRIAGAAIAGAAIAGAAIAGAAMEKA
jgi:hypothetical protein